MKENHKQFSFVTQRKTFPKYKLFSNLGALLCKIFFASSESRDSMGLGAMAISLRGPTGSGGGDESEDDGEESRGSSACWRQDAGSTFGSWFWMMM